MDMRKLDTLETKINECFQESDCSKENWGTYDDPYAEYLKSPSVATESARDMEESLKAKDDEVKVLWNVIKELNKGKDPVDQLDLSALQSKVVS